MFKVVCFLLLFALLSIISESKSIIPQLQPLKSFKMQDPQVESTCAYTVLITTSCSSPQYTRDEISIAFGDAYRNEVYEPRIDDPGSGAFKRCSTNTFDISGPCLSKICYLYVLRMGYDGWEPETVTISSPNYPVVSFLYNTSIPYGEWTGFDRCYGDRMISAV